MINFKQGAKGEAVSLEFLFSQGCRVTQGQGDLLGLCGAGPGEGRHGSKSLWGSFVTIYGAFVDKRCFANQHHCHPGRGRALREGSGGASCLRCSVSCLQKGICKVKVHTAPRPQGGVKTVPENELENDPVRYPAGNRPIAIPAAGPDSPAHLFHSCAGRWHVVTALVPSREEWGAILSPTMGCVAMSGDVSVVTTGEGLLLSSGRGQRRRKTPYDAQVPPRPRNPGGKGPPSRSPARETLLLLERLLRHFRKILNLGSYSSQPDQETHGKV